MTEPNRILQSARDGNGGELSPADRYATDVLLIADSDSRSRRGKTGNGAEDPESLDMESVVRKLIALLRDQ